jgi:hypothetical protein
VVQALFKFGAHSEDDFKRASSVDLRIFGADLRRSWKTMIDGSKMKPD